MQLKRIKVIHNYNILGMTANMYKDMHVGFEM